MKTIYVITYECNEYAQYGEYLFAWFIGKPTIQELLELWLSYEESNHIITWWWRRGVEHFWYNLREVVEWQKFQWVE